MSHETIDFEQELRDMLHRQAERAEFTSHPPDTTTVPLVASRSGRSARRLSAAAAVLFTIAAGAVVWIVSDRIDRVSTSLDDSVPTPSTSPATTTASTLSPTTSPAPTSTTPTTSTAPQVRLDNATLGALLGVAEPWTVSSAQSLSGGFSGFSTTIQRWGLVGADGVSLDRVIELTVMRAPDGVEEPMQFQPSLTSTVSAEWRTASYRYSAIAFGFDADQATAFIESLLARDPDNPMNGFDSTADTLPLIEEQIGTGDELPNETWLNIELVGPDGGSASISVVEQDGLARSLGAPNRRVRIGDRIGVLSPPDFPALSVEWVGDGIRYRVTVESDLDQALEIANAIDRHDDSTWHDILSIARTEGTATEPPAYQQPTSFLADQLAEAETETTLDTAIDDARIAVTVPGIDDYQFLITRYRSVTVDGDRPAPDTTIAEGDVYVDPNTITLFTHNGDVIRVTCISATGNAVRHCDDGDGQPNHLTTIVDLAVTTAHLPTDTAPVTRYDNTHLVFNSMPTLNDFAAQHSYGSFHLRDYNGLPDTNPPPILTPILIPPTD